jgi:hypothetical protein
VSTGKYLRATLLCNEVFSSRHLWTSAWCAEASDDSEPFDVGIVGQYSSCTAGSEMVWSDGMHFEAKSTDHLLILVNCCERLEAGCEKADRKEAARQRISASDVLCFDTCSERFWQHVMSHVMSSVYVHLCLYVFTCLHVYMFLHHITYHIIIKSNQIKSYHIISYHASCSNSQRVVLWKISPQPSPSRRKLDMLWGMPRGGPSSRRAIPEGTT